MKKQLLFIFLLLLGAVGFSQNIIDFFLTLPEEAFNVPKKERQEIVSYSKDNRGHQDMLLDVTRKGKSFWSDIENQYLYFADGNGTDYEFLCWDISNGDKLIAVYSYEFVYFRLDYDFYFYRYDGKKFHKQSIDDIIPDVYGDFFKGDFSKTAEQMEKDGVRAGYLYELPQKGKNIIAKWGFEHSQEEYKKYAKGDRMELIWNDGIFKKGKIYWEKHPE